MSRFRLPTSFLKVTSRPMSEAPLLVPIQMAPTARPSCSTIFLYNPRSGSARTIDS